MKEIVDISTGEIVVGAKGTMLRSIAIGSCIVIAAYDSKNNIGAMAHIMLPGRAPEKSQQKTKYAADAIDEMINRMTQRGAKKCNIEVCLIGGANILQKQDDTVCEANIKSVTQLLKKKRIPIRADVLGGTERKGVLMDTDSGSISHTEGNSEKKPLWKPQSKPAVI